MVFSSLTFLLFFLPIALLGYFVLPEKGRNFWLLAVSLFFYTWGAHRFVLVMVLSICLNYVCARAIDAVPAERRRLRRALLWVSVAINLGILFYNKYMNFATGIVHHFRPSVPVTAIALPIGISFFTFQALSYVVDVYRGTTPVQKNIFDLGLYIAFFPQLIAGPIVRYQTIAKQMRCRTVSWEKFSSGAYRFMVGFAQKVLLANTLSVVADKAFEVLAADPAQLSVGFAWTGAVAYTLQIFFDFSGYSSMAIGLGRMFGFSFLENFDYPYIARTVTEFWRRWHMSLGQWFRDYVYFPLGGSRVQKKTTLVRNLFVVWFLTGLWHGASFNFIAWGLLYFVLLTFEKLSGLPKRQLHPAAAAAYRAFTLLCVVLGWVLFRAPGLRYAKRYICAMFGLQHNPLWGQMAVRYLWDNRFVFLFALLFSTPICHRLRLWLAKKTGRAAAVDLVWQLLAFGGLLLGISSLVMGANNPFIYFHF